MPFSVIIRISSSTITSRFASTLAIVAISYIIFCAIRYLTAVKSSNLTPPKGCKRIGISGQSNLADQYDLKYIRGSDAGRDEDDEPLWKVKALFVYPIKSCAPLELDTSGVLSTGLKYDRIFCFATWTIIPAKKDQPAKGPLWRFITQRSYPKMANVRVTIWIPSDASPDYPSTDTGYMDVSFPSMSGRSTSFRIPLLPTDAEIEEAKLERGNVSIWGDMPGAINMTKLVRPSTLKELANYLGIKESQPFGLFRTDPSRPREVFRNAPKKQDLGYQAVNNFADAYPLQFVNLASVRDVAARLFNELPNLDAIRFRANVYITGPSAYAEDNWTRMRLGARSYIVTNRTTRCALPNVDPASGAVAKFDSQCPDPAFGQPLKALNSFRVIDEGASTPCLGMHFVSVDPSCGEVGVGDEVVMEEMGVHRFIGS